MKKRTQHIKLLTFTTLYPNREQTRHGIFIENRLRHLAKTQNITIRVVAPIPYFPFKNTAFGKYSAYARIPLCETRNNIMIDHPRYVTIPKIGMLFAPLLMAACTFPHIKKILKSYRFDVIDAHYFFPDGVAAVIIGILLQKPVTITARGSDISLLPNFVLPRIMITWAANKATALVTVCNELKQRLILLGVKNEKISVMRNGIDLKLFSPAKDRTALRHSLNIKGTTLLSVGNLIKLKGHDLTIRSLVLLPNTRLMIAGEGPEQQTLKKLVTELGLNERVSFLGLIDHCELPLYYRIADIMVLASEREGWANVLLESMACGTPVVATNTGGTPEVVSDPVAGILIQERTAEAISNAVNDLLGAKIDRKKTHQYAENFGWDKTSQDLHNLFSMLTQTK